MFNQNSGGRLQAFKYGKYLIVPKQLERFNWFGFILDQQTREKIHHITATTLDDFIEKCIEWLIDNVEITDDLRADIKKKYERIKDAKPEEN